MRRFRKLIAPIVAALLLLASGVAQDIIAPWLWEHIDPALRQWVVVGLIGFVVLFAVGYAVWDIWHPEEGEEAGKRLLRTRQELVDEVLKFAEAQFDGGLQQPVARVA
jgi:hypothetical protein